MADQTPDSLRDLGEFLASLEIFQYGDTPLAIFKVADEEAEVMPVPPEMAAQLPMMIAMIKNLA